MGLLLGASVITLIELLDLIIYNTVLRCQRKKKVIPTTARPVPPPPPPTAAGHEAEERRMDVTYHA